MLTEDLVFSLDQAALDLFAAKGRESELPDPHNPNGVALRRVMQIVHDLAQRPLADLRVLDLACGEGVYAIETALRGASVLAVDGRTERMSQGQEVATRLGLRHLRFEQNDVRRVRLETHGQFDIVYLLGILYHLDTPDLFETLEHVHALCRDFIVIDTHISLEAQEEAAFRGRAYRGSRWREHEERDPEELRRSRLQSSLDNLHSFRLTRESLVRLLADIGFTTVFECYAPRDPFKPADRVTVAACKGNRAHIAAYPWINGKSDEEIAAILHSPARRSPRRTGGLASALNRLLRAAGYEIRRL